jgi:hypothetical protein
LPLARLGVSVAAGATRCFGCRCAARCFGCRWRGSVVRLPLRGSVVRLPLARPGVSVGQ